MFRHRDPLAQNDVSEEDPMLYHFYSVLLRLGQSKQDFLWRQLHQHMNKTSFSSDSQKYYRTDECKLTSLLSHQLCVAFIVVLELSTDGQKIIYTSLSCPLPSQGN